MFTCNIAEHWQRTLDRQSCFDMSCTCVIFCRISCRCLGCNWVVCEHVPPHTHVIWLSKERNFSEVNELCKPSAEFPLQSYILNLTSISLTAIMLIMALRSVAGFRCRPMTTTTLLSRCCTTPIGLQGYTNESFRHVQASHSKKISFAF